MSNTQIFLTFVGTLLTILAGVYATRSARQANKETSQIAGWKELTAALRDEVKDLREQQEKDEKKHAAQIETLNRRVTDLTERFEKSEDSRKALAIWVRRVAVPRLTAAQINFPPPPIDIDETDPRLRGYFKSD